jgi:2-(1,2-epoxy-1,2-dihydrophenyl)acetyl-CoA isomerase
MVLIEPDKGVRTMTLNRPEALNAFNQPMRAALCKAISDAACDNSVMVVEITGSGRVFSAGADLREKNSDAGAKRARKASRVGRLLA